MSPWSRRREPLSAIAGTLSAMDWNAVRDQSESLSAIAGIRNERNTATKDIAGDLDRLGIGMTPETVLKYLKEGAKLLPQTGLDSVKPKTKSAKRRTKSD